MNHERHYLTPLLEPKSIAIVGASEREGSIGAMLARNMLDAGYGGSLHFVNPKHRTLFGHPCHAAIGDLPPRIDLAAICTQARRVPDILDACGRAGTRSALVLSGGFAECGAEGEALQRRVRDIARGHGMRLLGPNALGILRPAAGINLTYTRCGADAGSIGLISQSGALTNAVLDWARPNHVGFSSVISLGNPADVDFGEALDFLAADPRTRSIFLYIEGIVDARRFMSALRTAARCKPVLLIKVGRHPEGERAARSHCGALTGDDAVFDAALRRAGVVRLTSISQMFATAQALMTRFQPRGNRLAILTNGGGPGALAADEAAALGVPLAARTAATNPLDLGDDATPAAYAAALEACQDDAEVDGVLAMLAPQAQSDPTQTARALIERAHRSDKPLLACWMGEMQVAEARRLFAGAGIPGARTPEAAVGLFSHLGNYFRSQKLLMQAPAALADHAPPQIENARRVIDAALAQNRRTLNAAESQTLLAAFRIPPNAHPADTGERRATLRIDVRRDRVFGPVIGLRAANAAPDERAVALPPLNSFLIADLLQSTPAPICRNLSPNGRAAIAAILLRISEMACELPWLRELDLDLRPDDAATEIVVAHIAIEALAPGAGRYDHMAIHPYPAHLATHFQAPDRPPVTIRPIMPEDAGREQAFVRKLSPQTRYFRFMSTLRELPPPQLARLTQIDYDREMAFVAIAQDGDQAEEIGVARYAINPDGASCEFAIVVADDWQGTGLARRLMAALIDAAKSRGDLKTMNGEFLADNERMIRFVTHLGFVVTPHPEDAGLRRGVLALS